jgi:uncharacterized membrane protein HdeD (DUF308 family)
MNSILKKEAVADVVNAILGVFLFFSPWLFLFSSESAASWNAGVSGFIVAGLSIAALAAFAEWEEWVNLIVGAWVAISPWLVGFAANSTALSLHLIVGIVVAAIAAARLWLLHNSTPHVTA